MKVYIGKNIEILNIKPVKENGKLLLRFDLLLDIEEKEVDME